MTQHLLRRIKGKLKSLLRPKHARLDGLDALYKDSSTLHIRNKTFEDLGVYDSRTSGIKNPGFSKDKPSRWHSILGDLYTDLHSKFRSPGNKKGTYFNGSIFLSFANEVTQIIRLFECTSLFDYGSGSADDEIYRWLKPLGVTKIQAYDLGVTNAGQPPAHDKCDIVVCCDVLEHVHLTDLEWTLRDIFEKANKVVLLTISSRKAVLKFSSPPFVDQVHITIMPPAWWFGFVSAISCSYPQIRFYLCIDGPNSLGSKEKSWFSNCRPCDSLYSFYSEI